MRLRSLFALVVLGAMALAPCAGVCVGLTPSADARMACCADKPANEAKACCASADGRQNADGATWLVFAPPAPLQPIALKIASALTPTLRAAAVIDSHDPDTDDSARHVLLSVFLI